MYRAKRIDNPKEWMYGIKWESQDCIYLQDPATLSPSIENKRNTLVPIIPQTLCKSTPCFAVNSKHLVGLLFVGDIVKVTYVEYRYNQPAQYTTTELVVEHDGEFCFALPVEKNVVLYRPIDEEKAFKATGVKVVKVRCIGNIFDNPEMKVSLDGN